MKKQYRDEIAMVCHDMMKSAQSVEAINETEMREFEIDTATKPTAVGRAASRNRTGDLMITR